MLDKFKPGSWVKILSDRYGDANQLGIVALVRAADPKVGNADSVHVWRGESGIYDFPPAELEILPAFKTCQYCNQYQLICNFEDEDGVLTEPCASCQAASAQAEFDAELRRLPR